MTKPFQRGLSEEFLTSLLKDGPCGTVFRACLEAGLDARLREKYISLYLHGRSLARIREPQGNLAQCEIRHKYVGTDRIGECAGRRTGGDLTFDVDAAFAKAYIANLDTLIERAIPHVGPEERVEGHLLKSNGTKATVCCFDRQVQVPDDEGKIDLVGFHSGEDPAFVVIEVKRGGDSSIQYVPKQLCKYLETLDPDQKGLRDDIARSYQTVCQQLRNLGLEAPRPTDIAPGMPVKGLVIVSNDNPRSQLLPRAHKLATQMERPMYLWLPKDGDYLIPPLHEWELMGQLQ